MTDVSMNNRAVVERGSILFIRMKKKGREGEIKNVR